MTALHADLAARYLDLRLEQDRVRVEADAGTVQFTARVVGGQPPYLVQWEFGDRGVGWGTTTSHTYTRPGAYTVRAICLDGDRRLAMGEVMVYVLGAPTPIAVEDFDDGAAQGFVTANGTWTVADGRFEQADTGASQARVWHASGAGLRYSVGVRVASTGRAPGQHRILWSDADRDSERALVWDMPEPLGDWATSTLQLRSEIGVWRAYWPTRRNQSYDVVVDVLPGVVLVSVDGLTLLQGETAIAADGVVGLATRGRGWVFDDFQVQGGSSLHAVPRVLASPSEQAPFVVAGPAGASVTHRLVVLAGPTTLYREAEDYDWTDGPAPGYATEAATGVSYGAGKDGRPGVDFYQANRGHGDDIEYRDRGEISIGRIEGGVGAALG